MLKRNYRKYILKQPHTDELCRRCVKESETIQHITAACEQLAPAEYVKRYDGLAKIIHQKVAKAAELIGYKSPYYKYTPANELENENFKLYWNRSILTSDPDSNIIYGSNSKVTITKSNKTKLAPQYIHTTAKICNSWHMFKCKELFKLQIRPPSLILLITASRDR